MWNKTVTESEVRRLKETKNKKKIAESKGRESRILFGLIVAQQARATSGCFSRRKKKKGEGGPFHLASTLAPSYCLILRD